MGGWGGGRQGWPCIFTQICEWFYSTVTWIHFLWDKFHTCFEPSRWKAAGLGETVFLTEVLPPRCILRKVRGEGLSCICPPAVYQLPYFPHWKLRWFSGGFAVSLAVVREPGQEWLRGQGTHDSTDPRASLLDLFVIWIVTHGAQVLFPLNYKH